MKTKTMVAVALLSISMGANAQFRVNGQIKNIVCDKVYLENLGQIIDSCNVENGRYTLQSPELDASHYVVVKASTGRPLAMFWAKDGDISVVTDTASVSVTGSVVEDEYQEYLRSCVTPATETAKKLLQKGDSLFKAGDLEQSYKVKEKASQTYNDLTDSLFVGFAKKYPRSQISLNHVYNCRVMEKYPYEKYMAMLNLLDTASFKGKQWNDFVDLMNRDKKVQPGQVFPDIEQPDVFGMTVKPSDFRGKYVLVTIGAGTIKDYEADNAVKRSLYERLRPKGFEIIDILLEDSHEKLLKSIVRSQSTWRVVSECNGWRAKFLLPLGIDHISQNWLLDKNGVIIAHNVHNEELKRLIEEHVK